MFWRRRAGDVPAIQGQDTAGPRTVRITRFQRLPGHRVRHSDAPNTMQLHAIDHVQLAMPEGGEVAAANFYVGVLGFEVVEKPETMRASGGCWFRANGVEFHLGVDPDFRPARKAHPALRVTGIDEFASRCEQGGYAVQWDARYPGVRRFYVHDPFGNRIELLQRSTL